MRGLITGCAMHALLAGAACAGIVDLDARSETRWHGGDFVVHRQEHGSDNTGPAMDLLVLRADQSGRARGADGRDGDLSVNGDISLRRLLSRMGKSGATHLEFWVELDVDSPTDSADARATVHDFRLRIGSRELRLAEPLSLTARPDVFGEARFVFEADVPTDGDAPGSFDILADIEAPPGAVLTWFVRGEVPGLLDANGGGGQDSVAGAGAAPPPSGYIDAGVTVGAGGGGGGSGRQNARSFVAGPRDADAGRPSPFSPHTDFLRDDDAPTAETPRGADPDPLANDPPVTGRDDSLLDLIDPAPPIAVSPPTIGDQPSVSPLDQPGGPSLTPPGSPGLPLPPKPERPRLPHADPSPPTPEPASAWLLLAGAALTLRRRGATRAIDRA